MMAYADKMGHKPFIEYLNKVYVRLSDMNIGDSFMIDKHVSEDTRDLFIKCACDFMDQISKLNKPQGFDEYKYDFTDDFKTINRT